MSMKVRGRRKNKLSERPKVAQLRQWFGEDKSNADNDLDFDEIRNANLAFAELTDGEIHRAALDTGLEVEL